MDSESPAGRCWLGKSRGHQVLRLQVDNEKVHTIECHQTVSAAQSSESIADQGQKAPTFH